MNQDHPQRKFRYVEALSDAELVPSRKSWTLVSGWLDVAREQDPAGSFALLEGDYVARLPDGSVFKEVSFKTEHALVEPALPVWSKRSGRRWAVLQSDTFIRSDGAVFPAAQIKFEKC